MSDLSLIRSDIATVSADVQALTGGLEHLRRMLETQQETLAQILAAVDVEVGESPLLEPMNRMLALLTSLEAMIPALPGQIGTAVAQAIQANS